MKRKILIACSILALTFTSNAQFWDFTEPTPLGGTVNTVETEESIPVFSKDSSRLYFVRTFDESNKGGPNDQDIWYSTKDENGNYTDSKKLKNLNNKFHNAVLGINKNGTSMYLLNTYDGKKDVLKGLAVSTYKNGNWSSPKPVEIPTLDIDGDFYSFHVNEAENVIIISYKGPNTIGEEDLYVCTKNGATWSAPIHMGAEINSAGYEMSPFLSKSQDTLYFSSNGFGGEGDADIFYSVKQGSWSNWSAPINLGSRINSPKFDAYFIHTGSQIYWSSNRDNERSDIYTSMILTPPALLVSCSGTDLTSYQSADGMVDATVEGGVAPFSYAWSNGMTIEDINGLAIGEYTITVTDAVGQTATSTCEITEPLIPIDPVVVTTYENLQFKHNFGYNKNKLTTSRGDLKKFVKEIEEQLIDGRESITINIISSASNVPTTTFSSNEKLAAVRGENMKYDLIAYFEKNKDFKGKVNVVIVTSKVDGPAYENDAGNRSKYSPYQFVSLATE